MWADLIFYKEEYRTGSPGVIPDVLFPFWAKQAENVINRRHISVDEPDDVLKSCVCAVAEFIYQQDIASGTSSESGLQLPVRSFSNDGYAVTYAYADIKLSQSDADAKLRSLISDWLSSTKWHNDFVFLGV